MRRITDHTSPFRKEGLLRRSAPFLVAMVIAFAAIRLPAHDRNDSELLAAGLLNLGLSMLLVGPLGLTGVALGTAIPNILYAVMVLVLACRELGIGVASYVGYVVPRAVLGALPVLGVLLWFRLGVQVHGLFGLAGAGAAMMLVFGVIWIFFVYRHDPYVDLRGHLPRLRAWSRA